MRSMVVEPGHVRTYPVVDETGLWETMYIVGNREWMKSERDLLKRAFDPRPYEDMTERPTVLHPWHDETVYCDCELLPFEQMWRGDLESDDPEVVLNVLRNFEAASFEL